MTYTYVKPSTIHDPTTGGIAPATWGDGVNTSLDLLAPLACIVRRTAIQSIGDSSSTYLSFDTEDIDDNNMFSSDSPTRISFPRKGIYLFDVAVEFGSDIDGYRTLDMIRSGTSSDSDLYMVAPAVNGASTLIRTQFITGERLITDYYEFLVWHNAGAALDVSGRVACVLLQDRST